MKKILLVLPVLLLLQASQSHASFDEDQRRYLTGEEIVWSLGQLLPLTQDCNGIDGSMNSQTTNDTKLGLDSAITGKPVSSGPTQATIQWITSCVQKAFSQSNICQESGQVHLQALLGKEALALVDAPYQVAMSDDSICYSHMSEKWSTWTPEHQQILIKGMVLSFLGPDSVIMDFGLIKNVDSFRQALLQDLNAKGPALTVQDAIRILAENLSIRDEFLSY